MNAAALRLCAYLAVLAVAVAAESAFPRRARQAPTAPRWLANLGLLALGSLALRLVLPLAAAELAVLAERRAWGLLNRVDWPFAVEFALGFLWLDLVIYWQHRKFHEVPLFWRLHKVHHLDLDLDASSGVRFHPGEFVISMLIKMAAVALSGTHFLTVLAFEITLNAVSTLHHASIALPRPLDAALRRVVVTPDYHRVHHSVIPDETNSNYAFNLTWWDRLFGSYVAQPRGEHATLPLGLEEDREPRSCASLARLLAAPLRRPP